MAHVKVEARWNEPPEKLIKRFSRKVKKEGIIEEVRERRFFTKPSSIRRQKKLISVLLRCLLFIKTISIRRNKNVLIV